MDGGISDMINGVLSNPDSLNKIMTLMPVVAQIMNNGGSSDAQGKIVETTTVNTAITGPKPDIPAENLMADAEVMAALKNLIAAINKAGEIKPEAVPAMAAASEPPKTDNINIDKNKIENIVNMLGGSASAKSEAPDNSRIEKTLDTLKNFTSATSPENDHRSKLLLALKPFLKDGRKGKIDTAIKYMNAAKIIGMFGKNGFV